MRFTEWTKRSEVVRLHKQHPNASFYDVSTNAPMAEDHHFVTGMPEFSPFIPYGGIPVSGTNKRSDSAEGVWQGLKVIKGKVDEAYFKGRGRARPGKPKGHLFGAKIIGYVQARQKIYVPTYRFMVLKKVPKESMQEILKKADEDRQQYFFDVDDNPDIHDTAIPLSHASVLVRIINEILTETSDEFLNTQTRKEESLQHRDVLVTV